MMVSIIICTSNRAWSLAQTLLALEAVQVPPDGECELLVVDNGSTDGTRELVEATTLPQMPVRYVYEPRQGKGNAYNTGMAQARGEILLWTDDDVRPPANWIEGMCEPILAGRGQAVAGGVKMAPDLERPWMKAIHRAAVAETGRLDAESPGDLVGANMAFSREVLARVPAFDPELGPGALGFADETLFAAQLELAGYTIASALGVSVEHHFDASRLSRENFLALARKLGRSEGYLAHHWHHYEVPDARRHELKARLQLLGLYARRGRECRASEGCPDWEFGLLRDIAVHGQYLKERKRPRNYEKHGLVKRVQGPDQNIK